MAIRATLEAKSFWSTFDSKNSFWQEVNKIKFEAIEAIQYIGES